MIFIGAEIKTASKRLRKDIGIGGRVKTAFHFPIKINLNIL